jgi:hypothetical protein
MARVELAGDLEVDAQWLEETLLIAGDSQRGGRALMSLADPLPDRKVDVAFVDGRAKLVGQAHRHATIRTGTSPQGESCSSSSIRNELRTVRRLPPCRCRP